MPSAAEQYAAMLDAVDEQQLRLFGPRPADIWTGQSAAQFRFDPPSRARRRTCRRWPPT